MKKGRFLVRWAGIVAVLVALFAYAIEAAGVVQAPPAGDEQRADIIMIDSLKAFGKLEEAPVVFLHDKHTDALAKIGKNDCTTCHETDKNRLQPKFKRLGDENKGKVKDVYHNNCIGCHKELADQGQKTGPTEVACRECHVKSPEVASAWTPVGLDKSLHFRHLDSKVIVKDKDGRTCASCHHEYDPQAKKIFYAKGKEGACVYCHLEQPVDDVKSIRDASHLACVNCHRDLAAEKVEAGPVQCSGCHGAESQAKFKVVKDVPRLEREQPDAVLMTVSDERALAGDSKGFMSPVAFNHKAHEQFNDTCRSCHHKAIESCAKQCHTQVGNEKGGFVTLEQAMHSVSDNASCIGCHNQRKVEKDCAGCHTLMPKARPSDATCATCHDKSLDVASAAELRTMTKEERTEKAASAIEARTPAGVFDLAEIPETVTVSDMVDKYEPAQFPHRKIVQTLFDKTKGSAMAQAFHREQGTLCQGCHHNSPASKTPPRCASCHGSSVNADDARPGLKAAFHQQCIGCHKAMELEKPAATACADCHKERKK